MAITRQEIDEMYMDLFGRKAKDAGAEYWMDKVSSGFTTAEDLPRHLAYAANTTEAGRADLAYGTRLREQAAAQAAAEAAAAEEREALRLAEVERQEQMLSLMREQQAAQLLAQQRLQDQISMGIQGKGGTQQQAPQSVFGDSAPAQEPAQQPAQEPAMYNDIDSGGGYYRNPYASGYGMGYQDPYAGMGYQDPYAGMRYMPQRGLMGGPSGFGGKGGYSQPMYPSYGYSPYSGMSPGKGGYGSTQYGGVPPGTTPTGPGYSEPIMAGDSEMYYSPVEPIVGADGGSPYYVDTPAVPTNTMDIADSDPTQTLQGAGIASDGSNVVDFTPYAGDEFVRIGDQVVSRADLQRRGSDYYTRPIQEPPRGHPSKGGYGRPPQSPVYSSAMTEEMAQYPVRRGAGGGKGGYYR
jgi:hypothetical protein